MARGGDELGEGLRRTWLASERTYLAWLRTGFAALCRQPRCGKGRSGELDERVVVGLAAAMIVLGIALAVLVVFR